jgi:hypothetical protein
MSGGVYPVLAVAALFLAGLAALFPATMSWAYVAGFMAFEFWLLRQMRSAGPAYVAPNEPPYLFGEVEARLVGQYRYYFAYPDRARAAASVLAALGLSTLILSPWLLYRHQLAQAVLIGVNLFAVAALTKRLSPVMVLKIAASKGDRAALEMLEAHETAWTKIRVANAALDRAGT